MNPNSSRSHCCFTIILEQTNAKGEKSRAQLNLVDLAGSERIAKTNAAGQSLEEAKKINLSLTALSQVINALAEGSRFVPYRTSKLTRLLQNSLGGNSKTCMLVACSPHSDNVEETITSLRFAQRCACVKNRVTRNTLLSTEELQAMLEKAQQEILKATGGKTHPPSSSTRDQSCQTDDEELGVKWSSGAMDPEIVAELEILRDQVKAGTEIQTQLDRIISSKQLEIDALAQRLIQSNQRLLDAERSSIKVSQPSPKSRELGVPGSPKKKTERFGMGRQSMIAIGWKKGAINEEKPAQSGTKISQLKKKLSSLSPSSASGPRSPPDGFRKRLGDDTGTQGSPTTTGEAIGPLIAILGPLSPERGSDSDADGSHARKATGFAGKGLTIEESVIDDVNTSLAARNDLVATNTHSQNATDNMLNDRMKLKEIQMQTSLEQVKLDMLRLTSDLERVKLDNMRLTGQCQDQDRVITRQQESMKAVQNDMKKLQALKDEFEEKFDMSEKEVNELREKMLTRPGRSSMSLDEHGGARIVLPMQSGSVLKPLHDQQALGQLDNLLGVFSFGFGGGGDSNAPPATTRLTNMFTGVTNVFGFTSRNDDAIEEGDDGARLSLCTSRRIPNTHPSLFCHQLLPSTS